LYFVTNSFLGPFVVAIDKLAAVIGGPLQLGMFTWMFPYIPALLLIFEIVLIIAFVVVIGRRTVYDDVG